MSRSRRSRSGRAPAPAVRVRRRRARPKRGRKLALVFVLLAQYDTSLGRSLPEIRSTGGAIAVLTAVLYPYVYALGRSAFLEQSRETIEAARTLGLSYWRSVVRVALPMARPALAAGAVLAVMEALADFGAVNLLNYRAMTDAIYRVWYGAFDEAAALQLASVLVSLALLMVVAERVLRGRARYQPMPCEVCVVGGGITATDGAAQRA